MTQINMIIADFKKLAMKEKSGMKIFKFSFN
jgi:hypothetical protein